MSKRKVINAVNTMICFCEQQFEESCFVTDQIKWHQLMVAVLEIAQKVKETYQLKFDTEM